MPSTPASRRPRPRLAPTRNRDAADPLSFYAVDFESANPRLGSICQIGVVGVQRGRIFWRWSSLVNPQTWFEKRRTRIHGIDRTMVSRKPTFPSLFGHLRRLNDAIVVHHGGNDPDVLEAAVERARLPQLRGIRWLDSSKVVSRTWPRRYAFGGHGLKNVADDLGFSFSPHHALEDATMAAEIVLRSCNETGVDIRGWLARVDKPIDFTPGTTKQNGGSDENGLFHGERIAFTGRLESVRRTTELPALLGCTIMRKVSEETTMLVVGSLGPSERAGHCGTSKLRRVEELVTQGTRIRILSEQEFVDLVKGH